MTTRLVLLAAGVGQCFACTNFVVTKGASEDGSGARTCERMLRAHAACMRVPVRRTLYCVYRLVSVFACVRVCPYPRVFRRVHACASVRVPASA